MASIDKQWMQLQNRSCVEYYNGVQNFFDYAFHNVHEEDLKIKCPCIDCNNINRRERQEVEIHLIYRGIRRDYTKWDHHGECDDNTDNSEDEIEDKMETDDMLGMLDDIKQHLDGGLPMDEREDPNEAAKTFFKLVNEADKPLYDGCRKYSNLSFLVKLMHIKCLNGWSNTSFTMMLNLIKDAFPMTVFLPKTY
ncbi:hypothetical protein LINGRAHAP2_LOCUS4313 [Linum grandiflorum]